jgi:hypothetical protein
MLSESLVGSQIKEIDSFTYNGSVLHFKCVPVKIAPQILKILRMFRPPRENLSRFSVFRRSAEYERGKQ